MLCATKNWRTPSRMRKSAKALPIRLTTFVARAVSFHRSQRIARNILPPSSGNPGIMLNSARITFAEARRQVMAASASNRPVKKLTREMSPKSRASIMLAAGPASAIRNSWRPELGSDAIWATPPKIKSRMLVTRTPCFNATNECASSWSSTDMKRSNAAAKPISQY